MYVRGVLRVVGNTKELRFYVGMLPQPIVHTGYTSVEDAKRAFAPVNNPRCGYWIIQVANWYGERYYVVVPEATFHILRRSEFELFGRRWEVSRYC